MPGVIRFPEVSCTRSRGEASIFGSGTYKFVLKDSADVTIWTMDNISVWGGTSIVDLDADTGWQAEESSDEDILRADIAGTEQLTIQDGKVEPTTDNDVDIGSLAKKFRHPHFEVFLGYVDRARFSVKDVDEVYIDGPAVYDVNGKWAYITSQLTSPAETSTGNSIQYLYIDYSAIPADGVIDIGDIYWGAAPSAYDSTKKGFYHATATDDRCIFGIPVVSSDIIEFFHDGGEYLVYAQQQVAGQTAMFDQDFTSIDVENAWDEVYLIMPLFAIKAEVMFSCFTANEVVLSWGYWRKKGATTTTGVLMGGTFKSAGSDRYATVNSVAVITDSSGIIEVQYDVSDTGNLMTVHTSGFYFPKGM
jgi:hypothetical protein